MTAAWKPAVFPPIKAFWDPAFWIKTFLCNHQQMFLIQRLTAKKKIIFWDNMLDNEEGREWWGCSVPHVYKALNNWHVSCLELWYGSKKKDPNNLLSMMEMHAPVIHWCQWWQWVCSELSRPACSPGVISFTCTAKGKIRYFLEIK